MIIYLAVLTHGLFQIIIAHDIPPMFAGRLNAILEEVIGVLWSSIFVTNMAKILFLNRYIKYSV